MVLVPTKTMAKTVTTPGSRAAQFFRLTSWATVSRAMRELMAAIVIDGAERATGQKLVKKSDD